MELQNLSQLLMSQDLAREVSDLHKKEKALTVKRTEGSDDKVAERARRIAQDAFNLSETEVDQFMNSHNVREKIHIII